MVLKKCDDPYKIFRKIFVDYAYHKVTKIATKLLITFYTMLFLLQLHYVTTNFTQEIFISYGPEITIILYINATMIIVLPFEKTLFEFVEEYEKFWSVNAAGPKVQKSIFQLASKFDAANYLLIGSSIITSVACWPMWGDVQDYYISIRIFETYFGRCYKIPHYFYFATLPFGALNGIRLYGLLLFCILKLQVQFVLLTSKIRQISSSCKKFGHYNDQERTYKNLCLCVAHHASLNRWFEKLLSEAQKIIFPMLSLGTVCCATGICFVLYNMSTATTILKIRVILMGYTLTYIGYLYAHAGQMIEDETSRILSVLQMCPWYLWNVKNQKLLVMFMNNSLKPKQLCLAGFIVNYEIIIKVTKITYSTAMLLYNTQSM